jgi:hypothetical protein
MEAIGGPWTEERCQPFSGVKSESCFFMISGSRSLCTQLSVERKGSGSIRPVRVVECEQ